MKIDKYSWNEIVRFCVSGTIVTITDFSIYFGLNHYFSHSLSKGVSFTCAGVVGYLLNKFWVFKDKPPSFIEIIRYILINSLAMGINVLINHCVLGQWHGAVFVALIIATSLTSIFTYVGFKYWVFKAILKEST